jgi:hypothetical protein
LECSFSSVLVDGIAYQLYLFGPTYSLPSGYLFLCPLAELQAEDPICFRIPECIAYWSLDPSGVDRLSGEGAEDLGFPAIQVEMYAHVQSWDAGVYDGIHQFHEAKGFDSSSQEVAIELGCPLLQVSCDQEVLLAYSKPRIIVSILLMLSQCNKMMQAIGTLIQMDTRTRKRVLNPKMSNMVPRILKPLTLSLIT